MVELIFAEFLATYTLKKRSFFFLRSIISVAALIGISVFFPVTMFNPIYVSSMFIALFLISLVALEFMYEEPIKNIIFCGVTAYTTQHISYQIFNFIMSVTNIGMLNVYGPDAVDGEVNAFTVILYSAVYAITYWFIWAFINYKIREQTELNIQNKALLGLVVTIILVDVILNSIFVYNIDAFTPNVIVSLSSFSTIINCSLALWIQFSLLLNKLMQSQLDTVEMLWHKDKLYYQQSKENLELFNIKYHDLKNRIEMLKNLNLQVSDGVIKDLEDTLQTHGVSLKLGNEVIDVVMAEKIMYCEKNSITLTHMVDGGSFDFMSSYDIYSLFGNALQNAIEATSLIEDANMRRVDIKARKKEGMLSILVENTTLENLEYKYIDGLPQTTKKENKEYHGFGMKSIQRIVEKLNGGIKINHSDGVFKLYIMIPI